MKSKDKILKYIKEVKDFIEDYSYEKFKNDKKTINACVFSLSQIGELAGKVSIELQQENPNIEWRGIKALRNRIVHDYEGVNLNMVWDFLTVELNALEGQLKSVIEEKTKT